MVLSSNSGTQGAQKKKLTATKAEDHEDEANNSVKNSQDGCACCGFHEAKELVKDLHSGCLLREFSCPKRLVECEGVLFGGTTRARRNILGWTSKDVQGCCRMIYGYLYMIRDGKGDKGVWGRGEKGG
jgi:hypothetical protein